MGGDGLEERAGKREVTEAEWSMKGLFDSAIEYSVPVLNEVWIQLIDGAARAQRLQAPHSFHRAAVTHIDIINHSWRATFLSPGKLPIILHNVH